MQTKITWNGYEWFIEFDGKQFVLRSLALDGKKPVSYENTATWFDTIINEANSLILKGYKPSDIEFVFKREVRNDGTYLTNAVKIIERHSDNTRLVIVDSGHLFLKENDKWQEYTPNARINEIISQLINEIKSGETK